MNALKNNKQDLRENELEVMEKSSGILSELKEKWLAKKYAKSTKRALDKTMKGLGQEATETKDMAKSFYKLLESKLDLSKRKVPPTEQEVKAAIEQLKDIGRLSVFSTISIIPGGGVSLIGLEMLARKLGVKNFTFLPSAFRKKVVVESSVSDAPDEIKKIS